MKTLLTAFIAVLASIAVTVWVSKVMRGRPDFIVQTPDGQRLAAPADPSARNMRTPAPMTEGPTSVSRPTVPENVATSELSLMPNPASSDDTSINLRRTVTVGVVERARPAIVYISTTKTVLQRMSDPLFAPFDGGRPRAFRGSSLGSGFIVHPDGYIVTNNHVIDRARSINIELPDGRKFDAQIISADAEADLAMLKIDAPEPLPTLPLGDSSDLLVGEPVIAVGSPLGYSHSVSTGIVSADHRDLTDESGAVVLADLIQTDAAINPGNSGGPLLNAYGQVIGINTAIRGDAQNIGFAIHVNKLRDMIPDLMNPAIASRMDLPVRLEEARRVTPPATVTTQVQLVGPGDAREAVESINGVQPRNVIDAYAQVLKVREGETLSIVAGGRQVDLVARAVAPPDAVVQGQSLLGITVEPLTPMLAAQYGLGTEAGLLITEVKRNSPGSRAGLQPGDILLRIGRYPTTNLQNFGVLLDAIRRVGTGRFLIQRGNQLAVGTVRL